MLKTLRCSALVDNGLAQLDSVFRVLEPVVGKINEKAKAPVSLSSRLGIRSQRSEWFRVYRVIATTFIPQSGNLHLGAGFLLALRILRSHFPEGQDCDPVHKRL